MCGIHYNIWYNSAKAAVAFGLTGGTAALAGGVAGTAASTVIGTTGAVTINVINTQELTLDTVKDAVVGEMQGKRLGKMLKLADDIPVEVTEAGLSAGQAALTAVTSPEEEAPLKEPEK